MNGAHVSLEEFKSCWPLPLATGSPCLRVLPASPTSDKPSGHSRFAGLSDPTGSPELAGSPLFPWNPLVTCRRYVLRKQSHILATNEYDISVFPIERQGRLLHNAFNFGANCPLHLSIPAYHLPVYASRCLLPHTAQDSVLDCWLGFVKAVIADHSLPCASRRKPGRRGTKWMPQPPQNVACGFLALRSSEFDSQHSECFHPRVRNE